MSTRVLVALSTFAREGTQPLDLLKDSGVDFTVNDSGKRLNKEEIIIRANNFDGIVAGLEPYDAQVLAVLPRLKCISRCGVGVDNIDLAVAKERGIAVFNTPDVVVQPVAELTLAMIFDLLRKVTLHTELMRQRRWERSTGSQLAGKTVGVIGLGRIGRRVAQLLKRLDAHIVAYDIVPDKTWAKAQGVTITGLHDVLKISDIVTLHVAGAGSCLGAQELALMKKGAILINTARGALVDEQALINVLNNGHLAGAALDVYGKEPYAGPLCGLSNVILTPHIATLTRESRLEMEVEAVRNILKHLLG